MIKVLDRKLLFYNLLNLFIEEWYLWLDKGMEGLKRYVSMNKVLDVKEMILVFL